MVESQCSLIGTSLASFGTTGRWVSRGESSESSGGLFVVFSRMRILMMEHVVIKWSQQWVIMMMRKCWAGGHGVVWRAWWDQAGVFTSGARQASRVIMLSRCVIKRYMVLLCYHQSYVIFCHAIWYVVIIIVCKHGNHLRHFSCTLYYTLHIESDAAAVLDDDDDDDDGIHPKYLRRFYL